MKRQNLPLFALAVMIITALACGPFGGGTPQPQANPTSLPTTAPINSPNNSQQENNPPAQGNDLIDAITAGTGDSTLNVQNNTGSEICQFFIGISDSEYSGTLLHTTSIYPDEFWAFTGIPSGTYCILANACNGITLFSECGISISGQTNLDLVAQSMTDGELADIIFENQTGQDVCYLLVSPSSEDMWGDDWLGDTSIMAPNATFWIDLGTAGYYDIQWLDCDQNVIGEVYDLFIGAGYSFVLTAS